MLFLAQPIMDRPRVAPLEAVEAGDGKPVECVNAPCNIEVRMPLGDFVEAGITPKPLIIGRLGRLLFGVGAGFYFIWNMIQQGERVGADIPVSGYWIGVGVAWWYFSDLVVVGFSRKWDRWPQVATVPVVVALVLVSLVAYGEVWDPPLAWGVFVFTEFFYGLIAISFVLAAILAVPG